MHHIDDMIEIGTRDVHFIDIGDTGYAVFHGLMPHRLRLRFHAALGAEHGDRTVKDAERTLHLDGEVHMAGRVDDIDAVAAPIRSRGGGGDGDATLLLLHHVVHGRCALVRLAELVDPARIVEDPLGRRGLTGVNMRHDADISGFFECCISGQLGSPYHL